jgi:ABC-2 type transport system ATP-binding protein
VGLDIRSRSDILATIRALVAETGLSVLWATHLIDEVQETDDVVILDKGQVLAAGAVADVIGQTGARDIGGAFAGLTTGASRSGLSVVAASMMEEKSGLAASCDIDESAPLVGASR